MNWLEQVLPPALMQALGWTLIHSLWQGAVVALALAGLLLLLRQHSAQVRYRTAAAAMLLLLLLAGLTFGRYYDAPVSGASQLTAYQEVDELAAVSTPDLGSVAPATTAVVASEAAPAWQQNWARYFEANLPLVVTVWLMGLLVMGLRLLGSLAYVQRLRRYRVQPLAQEWQQRLAVLADRAGLKQRVELLESALVKAPVVVGHLRPMVLLPLGTVTGLSTVYLEAILAHELAHVQRRDYLLNLLQVVVETVLFYHPGVWFMSACLRTERENCCDDAATALVGGNPLTVARALAALAELTVAPEPAGTRLALSALGPDGSVLGRIRRLVQRQQMPTFAEGFMAACVVLVGLVVLSTAVALARPQVSALKAHNPSWAAIEAPEMLDLPEVPAATAAVPTTEEPAENSWSQEPLRILRVSADGQAQGRIGATPVSFDTSRAPQLMRWSRANRRSRNSAAGEQGTVIIKRDKKGRLTELYVNGEQIEIAPARKKGEQVEIVQLNGAAGSLRPSGQLVATTGREQRLEELSLRMQQRALNGRTPSAADARELSSLALAEANNALQDVDVDRITREAFQQAERQLRTAAKNASTDEEREQIQESMQDLREQQQELQERQQQQREDVQAQRRDVDQDVREAQQQARRDAEQARRDADQTRRDVQQARRDADQARRDADQVRRDAEQVRHEAATEALLKQLRQDGIVKNTDNLQFSLTATSLSVNGVKQPAATQQKYLRLVEKQQGGPLKGAYNLSYQTSGPTTTTTNGRRTPPMPPTAPMPPAPRAPLAPPRAPRAASPTHAAPPRYRRHSGRAAPRRAAWGHRQGVPVSAQRRANDR
ncbi:hypothetical protein CDA63_06595 [Hymenobacter amundsenii]|uniref:Peptidase M56 domain-containing protein n=1 Tax=Hymenobacter amundsenii TaxID=2006685 RepID=A0A246FM91_9BACT|nr:M56 family metallopeptidase [Hymenobacter amundsenii]OWP63876.1 hypothetical protein CDA63_06595 [Hymenobacter amundsenii]